MAARRARRRAARSRAARRSPKVSRSLSASALPTRISNPSNSTRPVALALAAQAPVPPRPACYARRRSSSQGGSAWTTSTSTPRQCAGSATAAVDLAAEHRAGLLRAAGVRQGRRRRGRSSTSRCPRRASRSSEVLAAVRERDPRRGPSATRTRASSPSSTRPPTRWGPWPTTSRLGHEQQLLGRRPRGDPRRAAGASRWLAEILGLPETSEGILTSGGSMANFTALATARRAMAPGRARGRLRGHRRRSSSTSPTRSTTASTRRSTSSASAGSSCGRSRPTSASASAWTC